MARRWRISHPLEMEREMRDASLEQHSAKEKESKGVDESKHILEASMKIANEITDAKNISDHMEVSASKNEELVRVCISFSNSFFSFSFFCFCLRFFLYMLFFFRKKYLPIQ
jgi:hypothetical protein